MRQKESEKVAPKINPIPGGLMTKWVRCGRANCRCAKGQLHGPYYYHRYQANGERRKKYVRKSDLPIIKAGINELRKQKAEARVVSEKARADLRQITDRLRELSKEMRSVGYEV
jgi:hypothetical protein